MLRIQFLFISLVLYSCRSNQWKIADFSLSSEVISEEPRATRHSRGTPSYRAPELILGSGQQRLFTNKVDIWAMGCLFHDVLFNERAFENDFAVHQYCASPEENFPLHLESLETRGIFGNNVSKDFVSNVILEMLRIDPTKRPTAKAVLHDLTSAIMVEINSFGRWIDSYMTEVRDISSDEKS